MNRLTNTSSSPSIGNIDFGDPFQILCVFPPQTPEIEGEEAISPTNTGNKPVANDAEAGVSAPSTRHASTTTTSFSDISLSTPNTRHSSTTTDSSSSSGRFSGNLNSMLNSANEGLIESLTTSLTRQQAVLSVLATALSDREKDRDLLAYQLKTLRAEIGDVNDALERQKKLETELRGAIERMLKRVRS